MPGLFAFLGTPFDMLIIAAIALLLFGNRLPSTMRSLGRGVVEFKKGLQGIDDDPAAPSKPVLDQSKPDDTEKKPNST